MNRKDLPSLPGCSSIKQTHSLLLTGIVICIVMFSSAPVSKAVNIVSGGSTNYNTSAPTDPPVSGWSSGWGAGNTNTGWNYVGLAGQYGLSGVYLGNGWVLTAAHVYPEGTNLFNLNGNSYSLTGLAYTNFTYSSYTADLTLFQISTVATNGYNLTLPTLTIDSSPLTNNSSQVVMIGYGPTHSQETWGYNTVTAGPNLQDDGSGISVCFETAYGTNSSPSFTNNAVLVGGDSGGGDFVKVGTNWELAGINIGVDSSNTSYMVQLGYYSSQINAYVNSVPEPSTCALMGLSVLLIGSTLWRSRRRDS